MDSTLVQINKGNAKGTYQNGVECLSIAIVYIYRIDLSKVYLIIFEL